MEVLVIVVGLKTSPPTFVFFKATDGITEWDQRGCKAQLEGTINVSQASWKEHKEEFSIFSIVEMRKTCWHCFTGAGFINYIDHQVFEKSPNCA